MKIRIAVVLAISLLASSLLAQWATNYQNLRRSQILDTASLAVSYEVKMKIGKREITDTITLLIGKKYAHTFNPRLVSIQTLRDSLFAKGMDAPSVGFITFPEDTYLNLANQRFTCFYRCFHPGWPMQYAEERPNLVWAIGSAGGEVLSYSCSEASTTFRGRNYKALFALDIPHALGPWKFGGLPGLILSIEDDKGDYIFRAIGIQKTRETIHLWDWKYHKDKSRSDVRKFVERMHKKPKTYMRTVTGGRVLFRDGDADNVSFPYNPIELE